MTVLPINQFNTLHRRIAAASDTLRLGYVRGFESGELVDRIYANRPSGRFAIGALIDAYVLGLPSAEALRDRKRLVRAAIRSALNASHTPWPHTILDLGSGAARYVIEALELGRKATSFAEPVTQAVCVDLDGAALRAGRELARAAQVRNAVFVCRDALNIPALSGYQPTLVVASGLFDHIDDERMRGALHAIQRHLRPAALIFSMRCAPPQPGDPLDNLLSGAVPRTRPAAAVEAWTRAAGFALVDITYTADGAHAIVTGKQVDYT
jgi:SAM-dependent methyltransferase